MSSKNNNTESRNLLLQHLAEQRELELDLEKIDRDPHWVAKHVLGQMAESRDIETVDSIVKIISKLPNYHSLVEGVKDQIELPDPESFIVGSAAWFRRMMEATDESI
jgi:hypothetical protein